MDTIFSTRRLPLLLFAYAAIVDWAITASMVGAGLASEANPLMAPFVRLPVLFLLVKLGAVVVIAFVSGRVERMNPSFTLFVLWLVVFGQFAVVAWNVLLTTLVL